MENQIKTKAKEFLISGLIIALVFSLFYFNFVGAVNESIQDSNSSLIKEIRENVRQKIPTKNLEPDAIEPKNWIITKYDGDEARLFNVSIDLESKKVCLIPKFEGTKEIQEPFIVERILEENVTDSVILNRTIKSRDSVIAYTVEDGKLIESTFTSINRTLRQPSTINITLKDGSKRNSEVEKIRGKDYFCESLEGRNYIKFGEQSIILVGDSSYDSTNVNVTQNSVGYAHSNISTTEPYFFASSGYGLITYIPFESWFELSGRNFSRSWDVTPVSQASVLNSPAPMNDGIFDNYAQVNGDTTSPVELSQDLFGDRTGTYSFWFRIQNNTSTRQALFGLSDKDTATTDTVQILTGSVTGTVENETLGIFIRRNNVNLFAFWAYNDTVPHTEFHDGEWHHVAIPLGGSFEGLDNRLYIDGVNRSTRYQAGNATSYEFSLINNLDTAYLGRRITTSNDLLCNCSFDEFMIFNRSLTDQQILDIYNNQSPRFAPEGTQTFEDVNVSVAGDENTINITLTGYNFSMGTNISATVNNGDYVNFSDAGFVSGLPFTSDPDVINITLKYIVDDDGFWSPWIWGNISVESYFVEAGNESCTYGGNGNWEVTCSEDCQFTTAQNISGNLSFTGGNGEINISSNLNFNQSNSFIFVHPSACRVNILSGGNISGFT